MQTRTLFLLGGLGAAIVLYAASRTDKGAQVVANVTDAIASSVIGFRLNNPLNIERGDSWIGLATDQLNNRFATFIDMEHGIRAAAITLRNYQRKYGLNTVDKIVDRWNPVADGQPPNYKPDVADRMGVSQYDKLNLEDRGTMFSLLRAMMPEEIGVAALVVSDAQVNTGLDLAGYA